MLHSSCGHDQDIHSLIIPSHLWAYQEDTDPYLYSAGPVLGLGNWSVLCLRLSVHAGGEGMEADHARSLYQVHSLFVGKLDLQLYYRLAYLGCSDSSGAEAATATHPKDPSYSGILVWRLVRLLVPQ